MYVERNPWIVVVACVVVAAAVYFLAVSVRQLDLKELLGMWFMFGSVLVTFGAVAILAYRFSRRTGASALDEPTRNARH